MSGPSCGDLVQLRGLRSQCSRVRSDSRCIDYEHGPWVRPAPGPALSVLHLSEQAQSIRRAVSAGDALLIPDSTDMYFSLCSVIAFTCRCGCVQRCKARGVFTTGHQVATVGLTEGNLNPPHSQFSEVYVLFFEREGNYKYGIALSAGNTYWPELGWCFPACWKQFLKHTTPTRNSKSLFLPKAKTKHFIGQTGGQKTVSCPGRSRKSVSS